ncbi:MAG: hypothetical protein ACR2NY_04510 [Alphaproteobacteria bacterium]
MMKKMDQTTICRHIKYAALANFLWVFIYGSLPGGWSDIWYYITQHNGSFPAWQEAIIYLSPILGFYFYGRIMRYTFVLPFVWNFFIYANVASNHSLAMGWWGFWASVFITMTASIYLIILGDRLATIKKV